jgi:hypothetical protein
MTTESCEIECGSEEERELRGVWMSRMMFGPFLDPVLAFREDRSYEAWLAAQGIRLV